MFSLSRLTSDIERLSDHAMRRRGGFVWIVSLSFLENTVLPIAIEPVILPVMAAWRDRVWQIAIALLLGAVLGGLAAYGVGALFFETVGRPALAAAGFGDDVRVALQKLEKNGFWAIFVAGISPFPYQIGTITAGFAGYSLPLFVIAITASRGLRYIALALLVCLLGRTAQDFIDRHKGPVILGGMGLCVLLALGALLPRFFA